MQPVGRDDVRDKDGKGRKSIIREMMEKQWKMETINSREETLLKRRIDLLTKQQRVAEKSLNKEKQVLLKVLERKHRERSLDFEPPTRALRAVRSMTDMPSASASSKVLGLSRRSSHVHVGGLPPLHQTRSLSQVPSVLAVSLPCVLEESDGHDSSVEIIELPVETASYRSATPPTRQRKLGFQPEALSTATAVASPLANRHAFKAAQKAKAGSEPFHKQDSLPPIPAVN